MDKIDSMQTTESLRSKNEQNKVKRIWELYKHEVEKPTLSDVVEGIKQIQKTKTAKEAFNDFIERLEKTREEEKLKEKVSRAKVSIVESPKQMSPKRKLQRSPTKSVRSIKQSKMMGKSSKTMMFTSLDSAKYVTEKDQKETKEQLQRQKTIVPGNLWKDPQLMITSQSN